MPSIVRIVLSARARVPVLVRVRFEFIPIPAMVAVGGPAPFFILFLVVDPADHGGSTAPPFTPAQAPSYWGFRKTPKEAIARWSWFRAGAYHDLERCLLLTYKLTAHGLGCAILGNGILSKLHWGNDGSISGVRLRSPTLEREYLCDDLPMMCLQSHQRVLEVIPNAHEYVEIS